MNERYRGVVVWGKTRTKSRSAKGTRSYQRLPESEWRRVETPEQRIVSEEIWNRAHERLRLVQNLYGVREGKRRGRAAASPYLFTGLLVCSECGGSITIVSGHSRKREDSRYGCSMHAQRGDSQCRNSLLIRRRELERQLLAGMQAKVLHPAVVDHTLKCFEQEFAKALDACRRDDADLRRQGSELERSIANQLRGLSGGYSPAITAEIARLELQLATINSRLTVRDPAAVKLQMHDTRRFVESRLQNLSALWNKEPRIAREEIAKHVQKITLRPVLRTYVATGVWDWVGVPERAAAMVVPGAGIVRNSHCISFRFEVAA